MGRGEASGGGGGGGGRDGEKKKSKHDSKHSSKHEKRASAAGEQAEGEQAAAVTASVSASAAAAWTETVSARLSELVSPHIDSFNYYLEHGLAEAVAAMEHVVVELPAQSKQLRFWLEDVQINHPFKRNGAKFEHLLPSECRESATTYRAPIVATVCRAYGDDVQRVERKTLGSVPLMVKSSVCNLHGMSPAQLIAAHEEPNEIGGYFIINGNERIIRMLIAPRRNYVMALYRPSFQKRGTLYTPHGTVIRCVSSDQTSRTVTVHYLSDGTSTVRFQIRKQEFLVPIIVMLKAMFELSDREIYEKVIAGDFDNAFVSDRVELMLRATRDLKLYTSAQCRAYIGRHFRVLMGVTQTAQLTDEQVCELLLRKHVFIHLKPFDNRGRAELLLVMLRKLLALVQGRIVPENADALSTQEIMLPGHIMLQFTKEKLEDWLTGVRTVILKDARLRPSTDFASVEYFRKSMDRNPIDITNRLEYFLATGNLRTNYIETLQVSGYTVVADKLNYLRYLSHFRSVHRGAFFAQMKTTAVRKLLPESWVRARNPALASALTPRRSGFLCPVHTPDGAPCGLLNHLAASCRIQCETEDASALPGLLVSLGMEPVGGAPASFTSVPVMLDGSVIGHVAHDELDAVERTLRVWKVNGERGVPPHLEIATLRRDNVCFPGLYLFSNVSRFARQVVHLASGKLEWISSLEQVYMNVAVQPQDVTARTTHCETSPTAMLSFVASLTPFSDFNQSPRNMYQCQMGKQTMGTPAQAIRHRADNKLYYLQTAQAPIVRNQNYVDYGIDEYPLGINAVVAVLSYTGYDMEDAMIINKSSFERGFMHGSVFKTMIVDLADKRRGGEPSHHRFALAPEHAGGHPTLDADGLPQVGVLVNYEDPVCSYYDEVADRYGYEKHKSLEPARIEAVRIIENDACGIQKVLITLRFNRNPIIGDKFSSRHGQKGTLSQLWPSENMPFSETGIQPDVLINPHAFPSRMTIGMLVESMAGKAGSMHGTWQDGTPFRFDEQNRVVDLFGEQLRAAGFNYYGNEPMYSGVTGEEMRADIYLGVVYYQRLRHMVSDKYQVRSVGKVNELTRQPVKGRKMGGGIRFGEMERDSLLAHGVSFLLNDRLMKCSDYHQCYVCRLCGSILSPLVDQHRTTCRMCDTGKHLEVVSLPYVFHYLTNELAAMNIRTTIDVA